MDNENSTNHEQPDAFPNAANGMPPPLPSSQEHHAAPVPPPPLPIYAAPAAIPPLLPPPVDPMEGFDNVRDTGIFYGAQLGVLLLGYAYVRYGGEYNLTSEFVIGSALYLVIASFAFAWRKLWLPLVRWPSLDLLSCAAVILVPLLTVAATQIMVAALEAAGWTGGDAESKRDEFQYGLTFALVSTAVLPAVFEEIAFRGMILWKLANVMTWRHAVIVSSALFAILHFNLVGSFVFIIPLACAAAWITNRTKSLLPAILIHFLHNGSVVMIEWLQRSIE